ncbi:glycosyltransferase [Alsobacter sp. R-9]
MRVCYLVNQYPKVSHSFIRREILAVEGQGVEVTRVSVRGWNLELVDPSDHAERERTTYVLKSGAKAFVKALWHGLTNGKGRFWDALALAFRLGLRSDRSVLLHGAYFIEAALVADLVRRKGIDHIHAHFGTNSTDVAMLAAQLAGVSFSFTVHGADEVDRASVLGFDEKIARAAFVAAVSEYGRGQLFRWCDHQHWSKIHIVHCGVDDMFLSAPEGTPGEPTRLVCVGRLCREKAQILLVKAAASLKREGVPFSLVLAGDGEMRSDVEAAVAQEDLADRVTITGWVDSDKVRDEIQAARGLVLPSLMEGLPVVIMEALALRRPVVSTYVGGIPELVRDGHEGWLVPAGSVTDLAAALRACLAASPEQIGKYGESGRHRVVAQHNATTEASKLVSLFREAAAP